MEKQSIKVTILADSIERIGNNRITTWQLTFPRFILAEMNTHRILSKNSASSRAIPFNKMVEQVENDPFIPIKWMKDHKGMQGEEFITDERELESCKRAWLRARNNSLADARNLNHHSLYSTEGKLTNDVNVTKQLCNRLLEPFLWHTIILTGTEFENFFALRAHPMAEIHLQDLAYKMLDVYNASTPKELKAGQWHIPFGDNITMENLRTHKDEELMEFTDWHKVKIATAKCAQVSYMKFGSDDYEDLIDLHDSLFIRPYNGKRGIREINDPIHCFDDKTEVLTSEGWKLFKNLTKKELIANVDTNNGKFSGFTSILNYIENDYKGKVYKYEQEDLSLFITEEHKLLAVPINKSSDRTKNYENIEVFKANENRKSSLDIIKYKTKGEQELIMFSSTNPVIEIVQQEQYNLGKLYGMFIGDGSIANKSNKIRFRFKRQRKILYLLTLLRDLNITYSCFEDDSKVTNIDFNFIGFDELYNEDKKKTIPLNYTINKNVDFILGLFDGLKNSDGSIKRNTWLYSTSSEELKDRIQIFAPLIGLTVTGIDKQDDDRLNPNYRIMFGTNNRILVNDSRKKDKRVSIEDYEGKVYCVEVPSNGIIIRRNNKTLIIHNCSPAEHIAQAMTEKEYMYSVKGVLTDVGCETERYEEGFSEDLLVNKKIQGWCHNLRGFKSYRSMLPNENSSDNRVIKK